VSEPLLTIELLGDFERRLHEHGVPIKDILAPGLSDAEMAARVHPLPLELSREARVWWGWHNGTLPVEDYRYGLIAPGRYLVPLERAVADYRENRLLAEERARAGGSPEVWWDPKWIPLLSPDNGTTIACDCSVGPRDPSPLHVVWWKLPDYDRPQRASDSLGQMIVWWIEAIDSGMWHYDRDAAIWRRDHRAIPPQRDGLV
jgi:hypothetical protein